ncbi:amphiregulin [Enhydra lutris kenyoni]|uniref:Amphiregulin n=1 Tax=Enhydra lutris kenyoni TaxID=391180 RepID=A0A2Y9JM74_ENHLU|nr:amphiregulin [Enhydra lutris kenyoni]
MVGKSGTWRAQLQLPAELPQRPRRRRAQGPMRAPLPPPAPVVLSLLLLGSAHYAAGLDVNGTDSGKGEPFSGDHSADGLEVTQKSGMSSGSEISPVSETPSSRELSSGIDYDYAEEYDNEPQISSYIVDDSVRVEQVVKPMKNKTESEKTSDKPKRKKKGGKSGKNRRNRKKKNPCDAEFQNFCIHGECKYIEHLEAVTCKCHQDYFGERCGEKSMKTHSMVDSDLSKIALASIAAFVSAVSFTAIAVVITIQLRKRYFREYEGEVEERKKLRQENGNVHVIA